MKMFKKIILGAMSLLVVGALASCGNDNPTEVPKTPEHEHTIVTDKGVEATCDAEGLTEGSHCSTCGEIIVKQNVIPALGHDGMVCSRCGHADITEEFVMNMSNSIDWENGVLLSMKDCDMTITLDDGTKETSFIVIPEIYVNLSTSTEIYGRLATLSQDYENDCIDSMKFEFMLVDDMFILNKEVDSVSIDGVKLYNCNQNYVLTLSYLEKNINNLYVALIEATGVIDYIQQFITEYQAEIETIQQYIIEYKDVVENINLDIDMEYPSNLINAIFDAKIDGDTYVISNNKTIVGKTIKEILNYLNNNSIEDIVNAYVKGTIEEEFYDDYFADGAFNAIFNSDTISASYDNLQVILEGIMLEDIVNYVELLLEEKMGVEPDISEPYLAINQVAFMAEYLVSEYIKDTNGLIFSTITSFIQNIPEMSLYDMALMISNDMLAKENVLSVLDIIKSIKDETIIDLILSSMGIEIEPIVFDAYLTILEAEINKYNKKFDFSVVTSKTGVIQSISMDINNLEINDTLFKYSFELAFGEYTAKGDYSFVTDVISEYNENMNKVSHSMFDVFAEYILVRYTIDDVSEDGKTITLINNITEAIDQYTLAEAMIMDDFGTTCVSYSYQSEDDEAVVSFVYNEEGTLIGAYIESATLLY
ncbi:MAG: hypothetical protein ACI35W_02505 [Anaeroplasmataceae bacterium]